MESTSNGMSEIEMGEDPAVAQTAAQTAAALEGTRVHRFMLTQHTQLEPPSLPASMAAVPTEMWVLFWDKLNPLIKKLDRVVFWEKVVAFSLIAAFISCFFFLSGVSSTWASMSIIACLWFVFVGLDRWGGWRRQVNLQEIQAFCAQEESSTFRALGYALECEYEHVKGHNSSFSLSFLPIQTNWSNGEFDANLMFRNGYFRATVMDEMLIGNDWRNTKLPTLPAALPPSLELLSNDEWTDFCSKLGTVTREQASLQRFHSWSMIAFLLLLVVMVVLFETVKGKGGEILAICYFLFMWAFIAYFFHSSCRYQKLEVEQGRLVKEYAEKAAQHDVLVKYRRLGKSQWIRGRYMCHFLYLFPSIDRLSADGGARPGQGGGESAVLPTIV